MSHRIAILLLSLIFTFSCLDPMGAVHASALTANAAPDAQLTGIRQISTGVDHTCAVTSTGGVLCWGRNNYGQLGDGTTVDRAAPVSVVGLPGEVRAVSAGATHTCAVTATGGVKCWGDNSSGQLGDGSDTDRLVPTDVQGLGSDVQAVVAAANWSSEYRGGYSCALTTVGAVKCWGYNGNGELGNGSRTSSQVPTSVVGMNSGVIDLAAGYSETCAVKNTHRAWCWGYGPTGLWSMAGRVYPREMTEIPSQVVQIAEGWVPTFYLMDYGSVLSLDHGGPIFSPGVDVEDDGRDVASIAESGFDVCVLTRSGGVRCGGSVVSGLDIGVLALTSARKHRCVLLAAGEAQCWGINTYGQLGDGTTTDRPTPGGVIAPRIDAAELASQSEYLTVAPGAAINPWVEVRNTGTTTWTPAEYGWNGKGALDGWTGFMPRNVAPGETQRFFWNLAAPTTPGTYDYGFMLRHGTQEFGPYFFVRVTVQLPSISGRVRDGSSNPIQGVLIDAGGGRTATTDASGNYTLSSLPVGRYTLTPTKAGHLFVPPSVTLDLSTNRTGLDFTAVPYSSISVSRIEAAQVFLDHKVGTTDEIPLIAGKQTMVRVYVRVNSNTPVAGMTARLGVRDAAGQEHFVSTVINGSVTGKADPDPLKLSETINFLPDPGWLSGAVTLWADVFNRGQPVAKSLPYQVTFQLSKPMVVGVIPISYKGQSVTKEQIIGLGSWAQKVSEVSV